MNTINTRRAALQSISQELTVYLKENGEVQKEYKLVAKLYRVLGNNAKPVHNILKTMRKQYAAKATLQWKIRKALAGNESYLTGADLNALRAFVKLAVNATAEQKQEWMQAGTKAGYRTAKQLQTRVNTFGRIQRHVRQMIVEEGRSLRTTGL